MFAALDTVLVAAVLVNMCVALGAYKYQTTLDTGSNFRMYWNITSTRISVGIQATTAGWIAIGFSPGFDMVDADLIVGWVTSGGIGYLKDYFCSGGNGLPDLDASQDVTLLASSAIGGVTTMEFSRLLDTGDLSDNVLDVLASTNIIWALDSSDPPNSGLTTANKHNSAGASTLKLCQDCSVPPAPAAPTLVTVNSTACSIRWVAPTTSSFVPVTSYTVQINNGLGGTTYSTVYSGAALNCTVTGLVSGRSYKFRLSATNTLGTSPNSPLLAVLISASVPGKPTSPILQASSQTSLNVSWAVPDNGGSPILTYILYLNSSVAYNGSQTSASLSPLAVNTKYDLAVAAQNALGVGPISDAVIFSTDSANAVAPGVPRNLSLVASTINSITIKCSDPVDSGGAAITSYQIELVVNGTGSSVRYLTKSSALTTNSLVITGLLPSTDYTIRVAAHNSYGTGPYSTAIVSTTATPPQPPAKVTNVAFSNIGDTAVTLKWDAPTSDIAIAGYNITRSQYNSTGVIQQSTVIDRTADASTSFVDSGLNAGTQYSYTLLAISSAGQSPPSQPFTFTTLTKLVAGPISAGNFSQNVTQGALKLAWKVLNANDPNPIWEVAAELAGTGWLGVGISPSGEMAGADIVIGYVKDGVANVADYYATGHTTPRLDSSSQGTNDVISYAGSEINGVTYITFRRRFVGSDNSINEDNSIATNGQETAVIYAYHPTSDSLVEHPSGSYGAFKVDLSASYAAITQLDSEEIGWKYAHGILMLLAWLISAPIAVLIARHFKHIGHTWYTMHWSLMAVATTFTVIAFCIVLFDKLSTGDFLASDDPVQIIHGYVGVLVFIAAIIQPVLGKLADYYWNPNRKATPMFPDKIHWWLGRGALLFGIINCLLGLLVLKAGIALTVIVLVLVFCIFASAWVLYRTKPPKPHVPASDEKLHKMTAA